MNKKQKAMIILQKAIEFANKNGFTVVVASDPEGNGWHTLESTFWGMTRDNYIAIGVVEYKEEDEVFKLEQVAQY